MVGNLKPCPHCGGVPELHQGRADITYVLCHDCGSVTSFRPNLNGRATVEAWNKRPPPPKVNSEMHMASSVRDCLAASAPETAPEYVMKPSEEAVFAKVHKANAIHAGHIHMWSGASENAYCIQCFAPRVPL